MAETQIHRRGKIIQVDEASTGALITGATTDFGPDDTIPQNTEGIEIITLAFTPTLATNILIIDCEAHVGETSNVTSESGAALFQDSIADALAASRSQNSHGGTNLEMGAHRFSHKMVAGTTSTITFKLRGVTATNTTINGSGGTRRYGGVQRSRIRVWEITA